MASHSGYQHLHHQLHSQPSPHLPPPPPSASSVVQTPDLRLPSLRSLNFAYPPVGEPGSASVEGSSQTIQQRSDPQPRTAPSFAQPDEYYHQRDMPYYQETTASSSHPHPHPGPPPSPAKRARSPSNSGARSPYAMQQAHHPHPNNSPGTYHPQPHEGQNRSSTSAGGYPQSHPQGQPQAHPQGHTQYPQPHQQQSEAVHPPPYLNRLPQPSQAWYYPSGHQPAQQQHSHQQSSHQQPQQHQQQHQQHTHQPPPPPPQNVPPKHPLHFQSYPPAPPNPHSPHQAPGHPPAQPQRPPPASFPLAQQSGHHAPTSNSTGVVLAGPGSAPANPSNTAFGSPPTPVFTAPASALGSGGGTTSARGMDPKALCEDAERAAAAGLHLSKVTEHCTVLCEFANRYAQLSHIRPSPSEVAEMAQRATLVLQLVEHLRRIATGMQAPTTSPTTAFATPAVGGADRGKEGGDDKSSVVRTVSKKRPWEEASHGHVEDGTERTGEDSTLSPSFEGKDALRSVAETDMAIIRSKRGQGPGGAGASPGVVKAKYRKRSRATPPGKCHSCNIRETPEWRRGPDGARTLCNACGLHYAKLIRKRDKTVGTNGDADAPPIDLEMLRASTRLANEHPGPKPSGMHSSGSDAGYRDASDTGGGYRDTDMSEIQLQPVRGLAPQMGVAMQVHQWTPPASVQRDEGYDLTAYSTSLMRSSNARGSPA